MRPPACVGCGRPVLELVGQYTVLSAYLDVAGSVPTGMAGSWHPRCLTVVPATAAWGAALVRNYTEVRQYEVLARTTDWTVVRNPRTHETLALGHRGASLPLTAPASGSSPHVLQLHEPTYWLEWDRPAIAEIQDALRRFGAIPIVRVAELLGCSDRLSDPELLVDGVFRLDDAMVEDWQAGAVGAAVDYAVRLPAELVPYCGR
jgi:hypothetical protein